MNAPCSRTKAACVCSLPDNGHEVHACTNPSEVTEDGRCHGQWRDDGSTVQYPTGAWTEAEAAVHRAMIMRREKV